MSQDWPTIKKKQLDELNSLNPKDRLDKLEAIALMDQFIHESCNQIAKLIYDPILIKRFNEKGLKEFYDKFRKFTLSFLGFDKKTSKKLNLRSKEEKKPPSPVHYT